jgi:hypothetical protein
MMLELNSMLAELAADGAHDSTGAFTVSLHAAEEKLGAYRLVNPVLFVLNLVAAAVSGGGTRMSVESHETLCRFSFDTTESYQDDELRGLFAYILKPSAPAHLRELALALHGARVLPGLPQITLQVADQRRSRLLKLVEGKLELEKAEAVPREPGLTLTLTYLDLGKMVEMYLWFKGRRLPDRPQEILEQLFHYCRFAPLLLTHNGQKRNQEVKMAEHGEGAVFAWRHIEAEQRLRVVGGKHGAGAGSAQNRGRSGAAAGVARSRLSATAGSAGVPSGLRGGDSRSPGEEPLPVRPGRG